MDSCSSLELSLSLKPSYVPKTITNLLNDLSKIDNFSDKLMVLNDYLQKHQEELSRIEAIKHEIPQCMFLLMDAIETLKEEVMNIKNSEQQHLMEFLSIKRRSYEKMQKENFEKYFRENKNAFFSSPSSCSQLYGLNHGEMNQKLILDSCTNIQGSQELEKGVAGCGNLNMRVNNKALNFQSKPILKPNIGVKHFRRSWTPELHSRFVEALEFLGGDEAATPKQIREIMKIEGLTNDQVKSHLQKFRLHNRRVPAANMINPMEYVQKFKDPWKSEFNYIGIQPLARDAQED